VPYVAYVSPFGFAIPTVDTVERQAENLAVYSEVGSVESENVFQESLRHFSPPDRTNLERIAENNSQLYPGEDSDLSFCRYRKLHRGYDWCLGD
jgi:hypothetical protein